MIEYIYIIENESNGKFYIGRTNKPEPRRRCHFSELRRGIHGNPRLQASFNKHGASAFKFQVVDSAPEDQIEAKESEWFAYFNHDKSMLYNCHFETFGGPKIYGPMKKETKGKIATAIKDRTRKYIFGILDIGYSTRLGLNKLARQNSVGSTTLLRYIPEWESLRGVKYEHPQTVSTKERLTAFFAAYSKDGRDVMRRLAEFRVSVRSIKKYAHEFGVTWDDLKLDHWKSDSVSKALEAHRYQELTGCSALEAMRKTGATVTTFYKYA